MKHTKKALILLSLASSLLIAIGYMTCAGFWIGMHWFDGFSPLSVSSTELLQRMQLVNAAKSWLGTTEGSDEHKQILLIYNTHEPLAQGYAVKDSDNWCATFGSTAAIQTGHTDIIPTECSCGRQVNLWSALGRWQERDDHLPLPGDFIYYNWDQTWSPKDNSGWPDHVGIVVGTMGPVIKVIEGNRDDSVSYRIIFRWNHRIRGYGLPDYASIG